MADEDKTLDVTQGLLTDLVPTETFDPVLSRTVSIIQYVESKEGESSYPLPKLSIADVPLESGTDFKLEYKIGEGGLGQVEAAKQLCFNRRVAIKRVRSDRGNEIAEEQLKKEAQLMGELEHPAIPPVHLVGVDDSEQIALVMKFIQGNSWLEIMKRDRHKFRENELPQWYVDKHLKFFLRIGEALEFAHQKSIIHRDIKPENVVIGDYGEVYLIDWGIACKLNNDQQFVGSSYAGTPCYASPEMVTSSPVWDVRSDVYLMGATLYQIISGKPPHLGKSVLEVFKKISNESTPQLSEVCPSTLRLICSCSMSKDPEDRYTSVHAMLEDIRYYLTQGELTELHAKATEDLQTIRSLVGSEDEFFDEIEVIGTRCRFRLEEINYRWPDNRKATIQLLECLEILVDDAINRKRIAVARTLLKQYSDVVSANDFLNTDSSSLITSAEKRVAKLADQLVSRSDELGTGIQVILIEEIAAQKQAYQDLRAAYINLKNKSK
tara:strand:+ start:3836 stop:5317 length:1482 start_codon:yes stop_codon:yes gene_type:complete